ncbi:uncharacterized protein LOC143513198 [Brachyhypopomus gauderio]|uniref:uncharacterized protein LOC143513198 n=1 Tax=Brachyhypopomus gauderio TaxID=698409 RepID=UPI0040430447
MKGVEEVKYMQGEEDRVSTRNQENLEKSSTQNKTKLQREIPGANANRPNIHTSESQQEFFRMLDEKIEKFLLASPRREVPRTAKILYCTLKLPDLWRQKLKREDGERGRDGERKGGRERICVCLSHLTRLSRVSAEHQRALWT